MGLAIGAGYVLGRTKKMKLAFAVGTLVAGKRMHLSPRALADLVSQQLQDNPQLKIEVEGHTCNIGTAEYNLALGERRATAVRDYLVSRGVTQDRLRTVSYGEERPKYDNSREETRRLNRRAALVVRVTQ